MLLFYRKMIHYIKTVLFFNSKIWEDWMTFKKLAGPLVIYTPFLGLVIVYAISLYRGLTITDTVERSIHIWTYALLISASFCELCSFLLINRFGLLLTGKIHNIIDDMEEQNGPELSVIYNGVVGGSFFSIFIFSIYMLYMFTENRIFFIISIAMSIILMIGILINIIAKYIITTNLDKHFFSELLLSIFLPLIICIIQLMITRKELVKFVYNNIFNSENNIVTVLILIFVLCYFLSVAYCYFSNIYCLVGSIYLFKNTYKTEYKLDFLQVKNKYHEICLQKTIEQIHKEGADATVIQSFGFCFSILYIHLKTYILDRIYSAFILLLLINLKTTKCFKNMLKFKRIRLNSIRFCCIAAVFELLSLDLLLFIHLESDNPCLKFFELMSTVVIIPILLSWLSELKSEKTK